MDALEKWKRLANPTCADDYGLSVTIGELAATPEGRKIIEEEIIGNWGVPIALPSGDRGA